MNWNDIRQHVATIFGNINSQDSDDADLFVADALEALADDGHDLDEQDTEFARQYAVEYFTDNH